MSNIKEISKGFVFTIIGILMLLIIVSIVVFGSLGINWFARPLEVKIENKTFQESQAYNEGMNRDLENIRLEYVSASPEKKAALRAIALHRFSIYKNNLPPDLLNFYTQLEQEQ
jgi:hypothetical protein